MSPESSVSTASDSVEGPPPRGVGGSSELPPLRLRPGVKPLRVNPVILRMTVLAIALPVMNIAPVFLLRKVGVGPGIEAANLTDLVITAPVLTLLFLWLYLALRPERMGLGLMAWMLFSLFLFYEGHGMHYTANDINSFIVNRHLKETLAGQPANLYPLVYFYDELLGHKLTYLGFFGLFAAGVVLQFRREMEVRGWERVWMHLASVPQGVGAAFFALEGQTPLEALLLGPALLVAILWRSRGLGRPLHRYPLALFGAASMLWMLGFMLLWALRFGGFYQPSELFKF